MDELITKRRITRCRYTKVEKLVRKHYEAAIALNQEEPRDDEQFEEEVRASVTALAQLKEVFSELQDAQDELEYNEEYQRRVVAMTAEAKAREEADESKYSEAYLVINAKVQKLEAQWREKTDRSRKSSSAKSSGSLSPRKFTECLATAVKSLNTGIDGEQLSKILETITQKKRDIRIPKFNGDPLMFDQWKELLEGEVSKPGYSGTEKAHFAISLLEGECRVMVAALKDPTYEDVISVLENKYGDSLARIEKAIVEISSIDPITSPSAKDLEPFYGKLLSNWNYLLKKTEGHCHLHENSWIFTALVRPKLPKVLVRKWDTEQLREEERRFHTKSTLPVPFEKLLDNLKEALQVARRTETQSKSKKDTSSASYHNKGPSKTAKEPSKPSGYLLNVVKKDSNEKRGVKSSNRSLSCIFCGGDHQSYRCETAKETMTIDERCQRVKEGHACFNCLSQAHFIKDCKQRSCPICRKRHHSLLHWERESKEKSTKREKAPSPASSNSVSNQPQETIKSSAGLVKAIQKPHPVLMQSATVKIESKVAVSKARVLFDSGSGVSFISKRKAREMQLKGKEVEAEFSLAGGGDLKMKTERVQFCLSTLLPEWRGEKFEIVAYVIDKPSAPLQEVDLNVSNLSYLQGLQLADTYPRKQPEEIDVMLGLEDTLNVMLPERITGPKGTPVAQKSHFGWILSGPCPESISKLEGKSTVNRVAFNIKEDIEMATKHWELEHLGILPNESNSKATELEQEAVTQHKEKTKLVDGRFESGLLKHPKWTETTLKENYVQAKRRLEGLERRLKKDPELCKTYNDQISELLEKGMAERVVNNTPKDERQIWYLPHHPVIRKDKTTTKVRIVFDGSMCGEEGVSINDTLLPGPPLQPDLQGVLLRFRRHRIAIIADIEKMFLQIKLNERDRDSQRFLWRAMDTTKEPEVYRLTTVTFGLTSSPFTSIQTVRDLVDLQRDEFPKAANEIEQNMFVDDVITGDDTVEDASKLTMDLKNLLKNGGFTLRKFISNRPEVLAELNDADRATTETIVMGEETYSTKPLGVKYIPVEDVFTFSFCDKMDCLEKETKRTFLRQLHRIYDPMGLISPFTLKAKQLFQQAWMTGGEWDDQLPEDLVARWNVWKSEVAELDEIKIQRCLIPEEIQSPSYSLHAYGDACEASYGAAVYIRVTDKDTARVHTALLCAKTKLAPLGKRRSLPELELMAALITARLVRYVEREIKLPVKDIYCWTDSEVVLSWIRKPSYVWQTFVANRVSEIQNLVEPSMWRHIPGKMNPADLCSRGCSVSSLVSSKIWWEGPEFLRLDEREWPKVKPIGKEANDQAEVKTRVSTSKFYAPANRVEELPEKTNDEKEKLVSRYENYNKFLRVMATCRSWILKFRNKDDEKRGESNPVDLNYLKDEELIWLRWIQAKSFPEEIKAAKENHPVSDKSRLRNLDPVWDEQLGLLCVGGRLHRSLLPDERKHPIILPTHDKLVEMIILHYHTTHCHTGVTQTLSNIRSRFWILHGRQEIRRVLPCKSCRIASKMEQKMASLPVERVTEAPSFSRVGCDYAGPLFVKVQGNIEKAYILIFTCMVTRAIHLELTSDMTSGEFLQALRRMMN